MLKWKGKPLFPDWKRGADRDMVKHDVTLEEIIEALENGTRVVKRKKYIEELWLLQGRSIIIVVVEEEVEFWWIRHVSRVTATKEKIRLMIKCKIGQADGTKPVRGEDDEMQYMW